MHPRPPRPPTRRLALTPPRLASHPAPPPALLQLSSAALSEEKEAEIVSSLLVELTLAQAKVLAMLGSSDKALRKAVAKAAVLLWYAHFDPTHFLFPHSY